MPIIEINGKFTHIGDKIINYLSPDYIYIEWDGELANHNRQKSPITSKKVYDTLSWYGIPPIWPYTPFNCTRVKIIDPYGLISVRELFNCGGSIEQLDITKMNVFNQKDYSRTFNLCHSQNFKTLDLSTWNTSNSETFVQMFMGCHYLETLDISNFYFRYSINNHDMFADCESLRIIYVDHCSNETIENLILVLKDDCGNFELQIIEGRKALVKV